MTRNRTKITRSNVRSPAEMPEREQELAEDEVAKACTANETDGFANESAL